MKIICKEEEKISLKHAICRSDTCMHSSNFKMQCPEEGCTACMEDTIEWVDEDLVKDESTIAISELKSLLKKAYLEISNADLRVKDTTSKSDVQSMTASAFRNFVLKEIQKK